MAADSESSAHTFVVNDAKRVRRIENRGEDEYRTCYRQTHTDRKPIESVRHANAIDYVETEIWAALKEFDPEHNTRFVPRAKFDEIMTPGVVLEIVQRLKCYRKLNEQGHNSLAKDVYYGQANGTRPPCRKLLAALIATGDKSHPEEDFDTLIKDEMSDSCLPLLARHKSNGDLYCVFHSRVHKSINKLGGNKAKFRNDFTKLSQSLMTPFISWQDKHRHRHYVMKGGGPLPAAVASSHVHQGGFGDVQMVRIDQNDGWFDSHKGRYFALKKLRQTSSTSNLKIAFDLEVRSLIFAESRANRVPEPGDTETKHHLIQLLATFEIYNTASDLPTYYLLFPWADGNLKDLWKLADKKRNPTNKMQLDFMVDQFYYLAKALQCVHNDRQQRALNTGTDGRRYGRHGDITPGNFLFFCSGLDQGLDWKVVRIVLADFGLGRLHSAESRSKDDPNKVPHTPTYAAPEYDLEDRLLSPKSDIFSLGCVFLLHIVWLFYGVEELDAFSQRRKDERNPLFGKYWVESNFWVTTGTKTTSECAKVKESVVRMLTDLKHRDNCLEVVGEILTVIEHRMLQIDQKDRFGAGRLVIELDRIREKWKRADSLHARRAWKKSENSHKYHQTLTF